MKVHSLLQKLTNKLKAVKPLTKAAIAPYGMNPDNGNPITSASSSAAPTSNPLSHAFYITNGTRHEVPYIKRMSDASPHRAYRPILLNNGVVLLVSNIPDKNGNHRVFTYNDMGQHMPDVNSDEMKVLSKLGTAVYSGISGNNLPVTDMLTGESLSLSLLPLGHIPVVIPNAHTGGLLDQGINGINNNTIYAALEDAGAVQLVADQIYTNGGILLDEELYTGDGWFWGEDAPVGTFRKSNANYYDVHGTHPMLLAISHLFDVARSDVNLLTKQELQFVDSLTAQAEKDAASLAFIEQHKEELEAAISRLLLIGYDPELGYIPGLTNYAGYLPREAYDMQSYEPEENGFTRGDTTKGTATVYDMPNMIGMFVQPDSMSNLTVRGGASMQYTDPYVLGVNKALFNDEAALQAFAQIETTYPDFANRKYAPGNLQGDAKILYDLIYRNRELIDATAREHAKHDSDFMISDGSSQIYPDGFDWSRIPVLSNYEGFKSVNLNEANENTSEALDPFTRFAIASLAHKRYRPSSVTEDGRHSIRAFDGHRLNMENPYALVTDGRPGALYNAATHRANHFWHDIRQDYIQYARLAELMRQAMEYAVPVQHNTTFNVHGDDYDNKKANSHLTAKAVQQLYPDEDIQQFRMDPRDNFMSHPIILKSYNRLYNGVLGLPARAVRYIADGMTEKGQKLQESDIPVISPVIGNALEYGAYIPYTLSPMFDIPAYFMSMGDIAADGVAEHWYNGKDQSNIPTMENILNRSADDPLDNVNPRSLTLAYRNASTAAERHMGENPDAQGGAEYILSILGAAAITSLGARGVATGVGNVAGLLGKHRMSNLVRDAIWHNPSDLVLDLGRGTVLYGDDALTAARRTGTLNHLTLSDDAIMRAANLGQHPKYFQAMTQGRYPWVTKPLDFAVSFSGIPRMNFTRSGLRAWKDLYLHMALTGQNIPFRLSNLFNTVDPFLDAYRFQRVPYYDENGNFVTISQPTGFDPTFGLFRGTTGLNNMEEVANQINNGMTITDGLYNTVGAGYAPGGSLVYKPYGDVWGTMFTNNSVVNAAPGYSYSMSNIHSVPLNEIPIHPRFTTTLNYIPPNYTPDPDNSSFYDWPSLETSSPYNWPSLETAPGSNYPTDYWSRVNYDVGKIEVGYPGNVEITTSNGLNLPELPSLELPKQLTPDTGDDNGYYNK